jgi:nitrate/nitrite-specific signal transduction histidine kinase
MCRDNSEFAPGIYSLSIASAYYPATVIRFKMRFGSRLLREEEKIFRNIGNEIAVALRASQDRKRLLEMQAAEVAMAERRVVFGYVHDQLGQNLGYLQLKLDQLGANKEIAQMEPLRKDLNQLRDVANQSYDIVRDILKKMQAESNSNLFNLLKEHALVFSERAKFSLDFNCIGEPVKLLPETQQIIFFAFGEILSNIEKHAKASKVDVLMAWSEDFLDLSVADNGVGFEIDAIRKDEHFGLDIMEERISYFNGKLLMNSDAATGTVISITIPTKQVKRNTL